MDEELTPEKVIEMGKMWGDAYLASLPTEKRLKGLKPADRLAGLSNKEIKELEDFLKKYKQKKH